MGYEDADFQIETIDESTEEDFYRLAEEYLPDSDYKKVRNRQKEYGKAYCLLRTGNQVIGVAFGWPRKLGAPEDESFCLNGIAVTYEYQRQGLGPRLLAAVERAAAAYGYSVISVGSAGGYVEDFYRKNGYLPVCYKVFTGDGIVIEKIFESEEAYLTYARKNPDGFVVFEKEIDRIYFAGTELLQRRDTNERTE